MSRYDFLDAVISYCAATRANVTSWIRTRAHNAAVGGVAHSAHLLGLAVDVTYDDPANDADRNDWAQRLGLRLIHESDHDHLQPLDWKAG